MITASIVLFNTPINIIKNVLNSYSPSKKRLLFLIDNSAFFHEEYLLLQDMDYVEYFFDGINKGYGAAHNIGIKKAMKIQSDYHLVLNPDIRFKPEVIDELREYADMHQDVGYILPKVLYPNGDIQYLCKLLPNPMDLLFRRFIPAIGPVKRNNDRYTLKHSGYNKIINPPCLSGCFMFMRTSMLKKNNILFDDRFFMYCEDFDLIRRIHRVGKTIFYPYASIIHDHAQESYKNKDMLKLHIQSTIKYFNKYGWLFDTERKKMNKTVLKEIESQS